MSLGHPHLMFSFPSPDRPWFLKIRRRKIFEVFGNMSNDRKEIEIIKECYFVVSKTTKWIQQWLYYRRNELGNDFIAHQYSICNTVYKGLHDIIIYFYLFIFLPTDRPIHWILYATGNKTFNGGGLMLKVLALFRYAFLFTLST